MPCAIPEKRTEELCIDALIMAAGLLDMTPAELKRYIHSCYYGHFADHFGDQLLGEAVIHDRLGLDPLGNIGIKSGGATGGSTFWRPPRRSHPDIPTVCWPWGGSAWTRFPPMRVTSLSPLPPTATGNLPWARYIRATTPSWPRSIGQVFGKAEASFRRTLAEISVKHHGYARFNPFAHGGMKITVDDVLVSPMVADPLRALDCCLMSVGAACAILCDEDTAVELTKNSKNKPLRIWVTAGSHTSARPTGGIWRSPYSPMRPPTSMQTWTKNSPAASGIRVSPDFLPREWRPTMPTT